MSGIKPKPICFDCRFISANQRFCHSAKAPRFKKGICNCYLPSGEGGPADTLDLHRNDRLA